ncbi:O-acyltransferase like protein [Anoplophora glabripennis]|nr:O-acyltransferase like protein [Anoplophora glabripennis]
MAYFLSKVLSGFYDYITVLKSGDTDLAKSSCILLISILIFLHSATARLDNRNLLQTYEDVAEDPIISESCQEALQLYLENLESTTDMWALRMFDASSKIPVGILSLNFGELGQFSQCLGTESKDGFTQGKYCLSSLPLDSLMGTDVDDETADLEKRAQRLRMLSRNLVTLEGTSGDSSGPLEFAMTWAICLPSNCSDEDIREITNQITDSVSVSVRCQTKDDLSPSFTGGAIAAIVVLSYFAFLMLVSTALDLFYNYMEREPHYAIILAFSVYSNGEKLFRVNKNSTELTCLNGIRFLSITWVLIGHVYTMYLAAPVVNFIDILEWIVTLRSLTITNGTLSVDTFFFLSGLLVVYSFIKAMNNGVKFNIFKFYLHRYLRLTPALAAAVLFTAHLLRYVGESPRWDSISYLEKGCQRYWWTALLYVQNYVNDGIYCLDHTWYLSIDMQLYILSPLILLPLWKYPKIGMSLIGAGILAFIIVPFTIAYIYELPGLALSDIMDMNATRDYMTLYYMKTHTRAAPWFIGLLAGYILARIKFHGDLKLRNLNKILVCILWMVCIAVILTCIYGGHSTLRDPEHDVLANSFYIGFVRPVWAICLLWVVFACANGYGGPINWFLSFPFYQVLNRLTYSVYILHYPLMFIYAYMFKTGVYFSELRMMYSFWGLTMFSFIAAVVWVLAFESPIIILEKFIFSFPKKSKNIEHDGFHA